MDLTNTSNLLSNNVKILKSEASKTAYQGVSIAIVSIAIATCLVSLYVYGQITLDNLWLVQKTNAALWILDIVPFIFGIWGQYSSSMLAYQAGAMIFDQTQELRSRTIHLEKQTNHVSTHDLLTDLPNRALFYDRVARAITVATSQQAALGILLIEIENFKDVYDTLGRNSSDFILKQISIRLQGASWERDSVAKIDGNIFAILMSSVIDIKEIEQLAKVIQKAMEAAFVVEKLQVGMHCNIGMVHFPIHGEDVDTLVQRAGVALHMAQKSHRGYALYESSFDQHTPLRLTLMSELRRAIEKEGLTLLYQPKVSLTTNKIFGAEALARWNHPNHGFISPDEFIPMAERTRMIKQLTQWVLKQAFKDCAKLHHLGLDIKISVNISTRDLHDPDLPELIAGISASSGIQPEWIMLEITESSVMNDPENALAVINRLHKMGYHFSIDDFGTGYSSLAYLKKLPLAELKIDKSFVTDLLNSESDNKIVNAIINLAHNLGLTVTAEGVETEAILNRLKLYQCDAVQGYYFSKPLNLHDFSAWVQTFNQAANEEVSKGRLLV